MVQVNATQYSQPLDDTGISFVQDVVQFACKKSGPTGNMIDFNIGSFLFLLIIVI